MQQPAGRDRIPAVQFFYFLFFIYSATDAAEVSTKKNEESFALFTQKKDSSLHSPELTETGFCLFPLVCFLLIILPGY